MFKPRIEYYRHRLNPSLKPAYEALAEGVRRWADKVTVKDPDGAMAGKGQKLRLLWMIYEDDPNLFYLDPSRIRSQEYSDGTVDIWLYYCMTQAEAAAEQARLEAFVRDFIRTKIRPGMTAYDKEKVIHDHIISTVVYDKTRGPNDEVPSRANTALGTLLDKKACCWGIANAFRLLCDEVGIPCMVITGHTHPFEPESGGHAWNIVNLEGKNYHVDACWDLIRPGKEGQHYDYFNVSDDYIRADHIWHRKGYPRCVDFEHNYFFRRKLYINRIEDLKPFLEPRFARGQKQMVLQCNCPVPEYGELKKIISAAAAKWPKALAYTFWVNRPLNHMYIQVDYDYKPK